MILAWAALALVMSALNYVYYKIYPENEPEAQNTT